MVRVGLFALILSLSAIGCEGTDASDAADGYVGTLPTTGLRYRVVRGRGPAKGRSLTAAAFASELGRADAVCLGEAHSDTYHHDVQLLGIGLMASQPGRLAVGLEMVQTPFQMALDDYAAGRIDEAGMLAGVEWDHRWTGHDYSLYRAQVNRALEAGGALVALNAPVELTRAINRAGLAGLTQEERAHVPELDLDNAEHRAWFQRVTAGAMHGSGADHYLIQVLWDETMAESAWRWLQAQAPGSRRIALMAGLNHCIELAIPSRLRRRGAASVLSVRPVADEPGAVSEVLEQGYSDLIVAYAP